MCVNIILVPYKTFKKWLHSYIFSQHTCMSFQKKENNRYLAFLRNICWPKQLIRQKSVKDECLLALCITWGDNFIMGSTLPSVLACITVICYNCAKIMPSIPYLMLMEKCSSTICSICCYNLFNVFCWAVEKNCAIIGWYSTFKLVLNFTLVEEPGRKQNEHTVSIHSRQVLPRMVLNWLLFK